MWLIFQESKGAKELMSIEFNSTIQEPITLRRFIHKLRNCRQFYPELDLNEAERLTRHAIAEDRKIRPDYKLLWLLGEPIYESVLIHDPENHNRCKKCGKVEYEYIDFFTSGLGYYCPMCHHERGTDIDE